MTTFIDNTYLVFSSSFKSRMITKAQYKKLVNNHFKGMAYFQHSSEVLDFKPVVKLFTPDAHCAWLLTEINPELKAFGLCDLGHGEPELGYVCLKELHKLRGKLGLPVERDRWFTADKTLSKYAEEAKKERRIQA